MNVTIIPLTEYTDDTAAQLGTLATQLTKSATGKPLDKERMENIIASPFHQQFLAITDEGKIVGTAAVTIILAAMSGRIASLQDFVVDTDTRGMGVADKLWGTVSKWCVEQSVHKLEFTSKPQREAAHRFYKKHGAEIRETTVFAVSRETLETNASV